LSFCRDICQFLSVFSGFWDVNVIGMPGHPMAPDIGEEVLCMTCGFRPRVEFKLLRWEFWLK
jgi:hypothetical protein